MSQENLRRSREAAAAFNRRDLEAFVALAHPDIELVSRVGQLEHERPYRGHDGLRIWWQDILGIAPDFEIEVEENRDIGDATISRHRERGSAFTSGAPMEQTAWHVAKWRDGKVTWWRICQSESEALEALGVSGGASSTPSRTDRR
jgi:ketosteroid isomerase-like protein